jgi:hypothetical protein
MLRQKCFFYAALLLTLAISCTKEKGMQKQDVPVQADNDDPVLKRILKEGFNRKEIVELEDRYVVEGDIAFFKEGYGPKLTGAGPVTEQARTPYLVAPAYRNVNVYLDAASFSINLNSIVDNVIAAFNAVGTGSLHMNRVTNPAGAHITIVRNNSLPLGVCGQAGFPFSNGQPFNTVNISETTLFTYGITSTAQLTQLIAHEIGHCIGLRHTNWQALGENPGGIHIPATPNGDAASVMNGASCGSSWAGFSFNDQVALRALYNVLGGTDHLNTGDQLQTNQLIRSQDGRFILIMQSDGNLVLYYYNVGLWSSNTTTGIPGVAINQPDGNFVVYQNGVGRWSSNTTTGVPGVVVMQDDGNLVVYQNGVGRWSSNTAGY